MSKVYRLEWRGEIISQEMQGAALEGMIQGANLILQNAVQDTPVDTGALRYSGRVILNGMQVARGKKNKYKNVGIKTTEREINYAKKAKNGAKLFVSFDTPYAIKQHEELGYNHPKGGKAKYLEDAFNANESEVIQLIKEAVEQAMSGG